MDDEERRLMRHEKEQERMLSEASKLFNKAKLKMFKAEDLYGKKNPAYKKAKEEFRKAQANLNIAHGDRKMLIPNKKKQARRDASRAAAQQKRQAKEYLTGKDVDISQKEPRERKEMKANASGGMVGASDMSAKKMSSPAKKKKMPQYYMGGGMIKKGKMYAYGGRVAKYKG